jgi:hypothetical protein
MLGCGGAGAPVENVTKQVFEGAANARAGVSRIVIGTFDGRLAVRAGR